MNGILIHSGDRPWVTIVRVRGRCPVTPIEAGGGQWSPSGQCHLVATSSAVLLRHSPLITDIHHKQQPEHKQQLSLYWKPVKKRNEKCLKEVWWRKALLPPRVRGWCGAGVTVSLRARGVTRGPMLRPRTPDTGGHRSPRRIGCDWWRVCSVRCRHSGPRCTGRPFYLYLVYLPGCTVSIQTLYSTQTGFFTGWLSALLVDTGHRPGSELGMSTDNTQAETPDAVLSPATLTKHHLIYYHIMFSVPCLFLMCWTLSSNTARLRGTLRTK